MLFERNESKVANLLATIDELVDHDKIEVLVECIVELQKQIEEQEKAIKELKDRLESHETFTPEFCRQEAEFQKKSLKERNESDDKDAEELREDLASFAKDMKEE